MTGRTGSLCQFEHILHQRTVLTRRPKYNQTSVTLYSVGLRNIEKIINRVSFMQGEFEMHHNDVNHSIFSK
jgi:hypothetical protein